MRARLVLLVVVAMPPEPGAVQDRDFRTTNRMIFGTPYCS